MTPYLQEEQSLHDHEFPLKNQEGQKEVAQHFPNAEIKELLNQKSIPAKAFFSNKSKIKHS